MIDGLAADIYVATSESRALVHGISTVSQMHFLKLSLFCFKYTYTTHKMGQFENISYNSEFHAQKQSSGNWICVV